ncbi:m-phase inducer phosphatase [Kickxella alabastrina]|uniref:M-phase inducer phosphatase n=1 Tax=Kickxella alabastrina TaxID=61397 RepID=A0ACC1IIB2_9FUNG|nr:m-phase inducer phosphatase [Kickxella alabastrina]
MNSVASDRFISSSPSHNNNNNATIINHNIPLSTPSRKASSDQSSGMSPDACNRTPPSNRSTSNRGSCSPIGTLARSMNTSLLLNRVDSKEQQRKQPPPSFDPQAFQSPCRVQVLARPFGMTGLPNTIKVVKKHAPLMRSGVEPRALGALESQMMATRKRERQAGEDDSLVGSSTLGGLESPLMKRKRVSEELPGSSVLGGFGSPLMARKRRREESPGASATGDFGSPSLLAFWGRGAGAGAGAAGKPRGSAFAGTPMSMSMLRNEAEDENPFGENYISPRAMPRTAPAQTSHQFLMGDESALECTPLMTQSQRIKRPRTDTALPRFSAIQEEDDDFIFNNVPEALPLAVPSRDRSVSNSPSERVQAAYHQLPCMPVDSDTIMRIEANTMVELLSGKYDELYDEKIIVDCRFPYEYHGGHIDGATNAPTQAALEQLLLNRPASDKRVVVVLHCEFSIQRAPTMARHLRSRDREANAHRYPLLNYPEIYVLQGGYCNFFKSREVMCEPRGYVEMKHGAFVEDCSKLMHQFSKQFKRAKSMNDVGLGSRAITMGGGSGRDVKAAFMSPTPMARKSSTMTVPMHEMDTVPGPILTRGSLGFLATLDSNRELLKNRKTMVERERRLVRTQSARPSMKFMDFMQKF